MTVPCAGHCHVYRANAAHCDCGAQANNPPIVGVYPFPPSYAPNPHHPRYVAPVAEPEIPASVRAKAIAVNASHLSADGATAFALRMGEWCKAFWDDKGRKFGSWYSCEGLPCGVVSVE